MNRLECGCSVESGRLVPVCAEHLCEGAPNLAQASAHIPPKGPAAFTDKNDVMLNAAFSMACADGWIASWRDYLRGAA